MKKCLNRGLALAVAATLSVSSIPVYAAEDTVVETETTVDGELTTNTTTTTTTTTDEDGNVNVVIKVDSTTTDEDGNIVKESGSESGKEQSTETKVPNYTVNVPTDTAGGSESVKGDEVGTTDKTEHDSEHDVDYTTSTVVGQGSVNVNTNSSEITESVDKSKDDLSYIYGDVAATDSNDNEMIYWGGAPELSTDGEDIKVTDNYGYVLIGGGNISQYWGSYLSKTPNSVYPDPVYTDASGQNWYFPEIKNHTHPGEGNEQNTFGELYINGEKVDADEDGALTTWDIPEQYILVDAATGEYITTYCVDIVTKTQDGFSYNIENLEDATYYSDEEAAMIRSIANVGYWGTKDDPATAEKEFGSLEALKEYMENAKDKDGNSIFTEDEVKLLSDGIALSATQMAIWSFSNKMGDIEFVNGHYVKDNSSSDKDKADNIVNFRWGAQAIGSGGIPTEKEAQANLLFKLYNHLIHIEPTVIADEDKTTANTLINEDNFLGDMSVTVLEKDNGHANNQDEDTTNDAYVTDLRFALVVEPSNDDEIMVKVITDNDTYTARIAKNPKEGTNYLSKDENGNYIFPGITLIEGNQIFNITLEGIQNLDHGVYLYTSEVVEGTSSQTMVGVAEGERAYNISMNLSFEFNVDEEVIVKEHVWSDEWSEEYDEETGDENLGSEETESEEETETESVPGNENWTPGGGDGTVEIEDEDVPLADAPETGDIAMMLLAAAAVSGTGFLAVARKKKED